MVILGVNPVNFNQHKVYIYDTATDLAEATTEFIASYCQQLASQQSSVSFALSGGSTPVQVYRKLIQGAALEVMPWKQMQFYFGDERYVPHDDNQSNYKMAMNAFLADAPVSGSQVHAIPTDCEQPETCAAQYEDLMKRNLGLKPVIDLALLGMGDDGHTASLFPGTDILNEKTRIASAVFVEKFNSWRISMTYPVFNQAKCVCALVAGETKAEVLKQVMTQPDTGYPIQKINNPAGMVWLVDKAAASVL